MEIKRILAITAFIGSMSLAHAGLLLNTGTGNGTTFRGADSGPGQGIAVGVNTTITSFAFDFAMPNGGDVRFMIWDGTNTQLLYNEVDSIAASGTAAFHSTVPLSAYNLLAGNTYYFGIIADNNINIQYDYPPLNLTQNNLTALNTGNSNYSSFASPTSVGAGLASIDLELFGVQGLTTPEPSTWLSGLSGLALIGFRRFRSKK